LLFAKSNRCVIEAEQLPQLVDLVLLLFAAAAKKSYSALHGGIGY
jgi:hypothetical protein